jgi:hypothetical protein
VNDLHRVWGLAHSARAPGGLGNLATVDIHSNCVLANGAFEEG